MNNSNLLNKKQKIFNDLLNNPNRSLFGLIDIDNFSDYNRLHSFEAGNVVLNELQILIINYLKPNFLLRLGSDEFYFSCDESFIVKKKLFIELLAKIQEELNLTTSIGLTEMVNVTDPQILFNQLRKNLNYSKINGKNLISIL